ncbi:SDR family oxidoreductase [Bacillus sp. ISL-47]|uniref:SDR family oxidoreductase n=1 Tax=Bacillus sp. ISL-47 TaxID=2819130 RepID=UPI001BEB6F23|nr:SDR family oxidoreductase [Bacillus sp. ISL-47]MBT2689726.1 SDR family oxidoreductase [Bacillus sp. ISL-47]MBT2709968.1 SDR family oxidoreductase [Pseudomonas sp. ISL-84]
MGKKYAVITGCSGGFGTLMAIELAKNNFHVIATMRNMEKSHLLMEKATAERVQELISVQEMDVTSAESIEDLKTFLNNLSSVDVLINNAGYAGAGFVEEIPLDEYRSQFETNVFGTIAVTQAVLPFMRKQRKGTIINISSISGRAGFPGLSPYAASKFAIEGWSESLRLEMKPFGVNIALIEPGSFRTGIWTTGKKVTEQSMKKDSPYYAYMRKIQDYLDNGEPFFEDPIIVAKKAASIALEKNPGLRYPVGKGVRGRINLKKMLSWKTWEKVIMKTLYKN